MGNIQERKGLWASCNLTLHLTTLPLTHLTDTIALARSPSSPQQRSARVHSVSFLQQHLEIPYVGVEYLQRARNFTIDLGEA